MLGDSLWERHAAWWQQGFTEGADPEYEEQVLPLVEEHLRGARRVLDVGCGEGHIARRIALLGTDVLGLDPTPSQIRAAHDRGGSARFARSRAEQLPCADRTFDAVVICLALEHVDPFEPALREVARVLAPGEGSSWFWSTRSSRRPGAAGWTTRSQPSTTGGSGPTCQTTWRSTRSLPASTCPSPTGPSAATSTPWRGGPARRGHGRAVTATRGPPRDRRLHHRGQHPAAAVAAGTTSRLRARPPVTSPGAPT